jgi:hypothetical protein
MLKQQLEETCIVVYPRWSHSPSCGVIALLVAILLGGTRFPVGRSYVIWGGVLKQPGQVGRIEAG